ncbi:DUF1868 domain-containing protein [Rhizobium mesoamericanum]|uniref:DUF1868 domain-containing protein n=1 Tax=Rhizobium mesoamericanum STM3625 TaxID=1211777 RepID=K0PVE2_9HYPH|nr:DUF1868 domain-containing protein [Rhizobium mesoamericanum]CCM77743.1 conserved hypothetical protein [Rhizobium mesoamericanum STM3625]
MTSAFSPSLLTYSTVHNPAPPSHVGTRYDASGTFLREPGNTVVCHLVEAAPSQQAIIEARQSFLAMPEASQFAFTPISSLHMTLFQGIIEYRRSRPYWPADVALNTGIERMNEIFLDRLQSFEPLGPFDIEVTEVTPVGLTVDGITPADRRIMKEWRDAFARVFGYRHPDHDTYAFHITFCYPIARLPEAALPAWQVMLDGTLATLRETVPVIELKPPAFCTFNDMNRFEERLVFAPAA